MSEEAPPVLGPPKNLPAGIIKAMRPRQWVKNLLVLAAPLAALGSEAQYDYREVLTRVGVAFVVFCMAASCIYLINDARDVEADRQHPTKQYRPIAAGVVPVSLAYALAAVLGVASLAISWWVMTPSTSTSVTPATWTATTTRSSGIAAPPVSRNSVCRGERLGTAKVILSVWGSTASIAVTSAK